MKQRLRFMRFQLERFPSGQCRARVRLAWPDGQRFLGEARGLTSPAGELRCAAQSCLQALAQAVHEPAFELVGVKALHAFDATVVIVSLATSTQGVGPRIVGICLTESDPPRGAALAVLNATNRLLGRIIQPKPS